MLVIGVHKYLSALDFNLVKPKFGGKVTKDVSIKKNLSEFGETGVGGYEMGHF